MRTRLRKKSSDRNSASTKAGETQLQARSFGDSSQTKEEVSPASPEKSIGYNFGQIEVQPATQRVIQPKLSIGRTNNKYEQEADHVADRVVNHINVPVQLSTDQSNPVQRQEEVLKDDKVQMKPLANVIQRDNNKVSLSTLDQKASKAPKTFLKEDAGASWANVIKMYKDKVLTKDVGMKAVLALRLQETLLKDEDSSKRIDFSEEKETLKKPSIMQEVRDSKEIKNKQAEFTKKLGEKPKALTWNYGAGGDSPTSDIDSNLNGDLTGYAVQIFNNKFRQEWGKESGKVFDVNVYARDYLPSAITEKDSLGSANKKARLEAAEKGVKKENELTSEQFQQYGMKFETNLKGRTQKEDMAREEIFSLVKVRMDMGQADWEKYKQIHIFSFKNNPETHQKMLNKIRLVEEKYAQREKAIEKQLINIEKQAGKSKLSDEEKRMEAENRVYAQKLEAVERLRLQLLMLQKSGASVNQIEKISILLKRALYEASMFANEAYITGGTVKHVVGNKQVLSTKSKDPTKTGKEVRTSKLNEDIAKKTKEIEEARSRNEDTKAMENQLEEFKLLLEVADAKNIKIKLTLDEYLHSFNEQLGFTFKELNLYGKSKNGNDSTPYALLKSAKYLYRMGNAIKHIENLTGRKVIQPVSTEDFTKFRRALMGIKVNSSLTPEKQEKEIKDNLTPQWQNINESKATLLQLSAEVQKIYIESQGSLKK